MLDMGIKEIKAIRLERLRQLIDDRYNGNAGRCADFMGMKRPQLNRWLTPNEETRQGISEDSARAIEMKHGLPRGWMDSEPMDELPLLDAIMNLDNLVPIPRVDLRVTAGIVGFSVEQQIGDRAPLFFRRDWMDSRGYRPEALYVLDVRGSSMETGLFEGDSIVMNADDTEPRDGDVYVVNFDGEIVVKRLKRDMGEWWLTSDNPDKRHFPDKRCYENVFLLGRVVHKQSERI
jgi:phage repressor protein C with HTH and peptisase S24 domain